VEWTDISQDRDKWRVLLNGVMNTVFVLCKMWVHSTSWRTVSFCRNLFQAVS
jgi:hypothetical protein